MTVTPILLCSSPVQDLLSGQIRISMNSVHLKLLNYAHNLATLTLFADNGSLGANNMSKEFNSGD